MKKSNLKNLYVTLISFVAFLLWTLVVLFLDIQAIGPNGSSVGLATLNSYYHNIIGNNMVLYTITDWLGLVPILFMFGFATLGFIQLVKRKSILKVDFNILLLGGVYILIFFSFIFFEIFIVNYRPVLIEGVLEASYPSSTTLLVMCVMPTAIIQFNYRIKSKISKIIIITLVALFTAFMVISRLISGVHWFTDIIGGIFLSSSIVSLYKFACSFKLVK